MTVNAITDTKKGRTGIAPTYLHTTRNGHCYNGKRIGTRTRSIEWCHAERVLSAIAKFLVYPIGKGRGGVASVVKVTLDARYRSPCISAY